MPTNYEPANTALPFPLVWRPIHIRAQGSYGIDNFGNACALAWHESLDIIKKTYLFITKLFTSEVSPKNIAGPIGVFHLTFRVAGGSFSKFIFFLALISVNLAIVNLLPIPVLDGGHLLFLGVEKIKGSPVSERIMEYVTYAGLLLLLTLVLFATKNDIVRMFWES